MLKCWSCSNTLAITDITMLDLDHAVINYNHASCGNRNGHRSFVSIKEVAVSEGKDVSVFQANRRISQDDFDLPFPIRRSGRTINRPSYTCSSCNVTFDNGDQHVIEGRTLCPSCLGNEYRSCHQCHEWVRRDAVVDVQGYRYCQTCASRFRLCPRCNNRYPDAYFQNPPNCHSCYDELQAFERRTTFVRPHFIHSDELQHIIDDPDSEA